MKILVFDNYDSFTYNLVHLVEAITGSRVDVRRNDELDLEEVKAWDKIILSPGPGIPEEAGLLLPLIREYAPTKSILGVCLGHQAIGQAFGGTLVNLKQVFHGVATPITVGSQQQAAGNNSKSSLLLQTADSRLFSGLPKEIEVGRYHSWVVSSEAWPEDLQVTALDAEGYIMGLQHSTYDVQGVQFHPESVLTPSGATIIKNWLSQ